MTYDLHALFIGTSAPVRSAFNRVKRKMAPLRKEMTGLILDHKHFDTHLNSKAETIDKELELSMQHQHLQKYGLYW